MENKNLNDIVIEDADSSKKTQLKNILTLLALLFIILVISIVITKLILGSDEENSEPAMVTTEVNKSQNSTLTHTGTAALAGAATALAANTLSNRSETTTANTTNNSSSSKAPLLSERNTSSRTKATLREEPVKSNTGKKRATHTESTKTPKKVSTYTRPKYVVTKNPVKKDTTKEPVKHVASATRGYYIKVGAFKDAATAIKNIKSIKLKYKTIKTKDGLTRVLIGPFYSHKDAQNHLAKAKAHVARDAYITKIK